jgi:hypothetical protein
VRHFGIRQAVCGQARFSTPMGGWLPLNTNALIQLQKQEAGAIVQGQRIALVHTFSPLCERLFGTRRPIPTFSRRDTVNLGRNARD